ncbi:MULTISPECIES: hypothetical protein [Rhodopseudomonas]|uniref:Tyr recombinase domain-containing protein n=1 Tax=Rhodopseudomonas palustris TaxID=1076 RepID=A0A0D7EEJ1_RHOPL|nr:MULTISPECIES: hypothetical protein [Rhodopseudomonas]KIZ39066.1 hypothetical protein OO17_21655 [Rhodopseudomonas palustris]MDF3809295.1 hypothetical protein [Rhodopseudomonas sp. BAL398]WOK19022.1 hypothetical protein RBJ75_05750 [Rhodopseudomonas sp. BAL398]
MAKISLPYVAWRDGRPRFVPGARERALGFKGQDLRHDDGRWFSLDEARGFALTRQQEIATQRATGRRLKTPPVPRGRTVADLWEAYIRSNEFRGNAALGVKGLAPSSQATYRKWVRPLQAEPLWHAPVGSLDPIILKALHERVQAARGLAMAKGMMAVLQSMLSWGRLRGWLPKVQGHTIENPANRLKLPQAPVRLRIGSDVEIVALVAASDAVACNGVVLSAIGDGVLTGLFSGQRKKDVLNFIPGSASNSRIELVQSKTGARVSIPMAPRLLERIEQGRARRARAGYRVTAANIVINEGLGLPYNGATFADHFQQVRAAAVEAGCASVADFTFPDLRDTAVTWYARAGCTVPEIASITGHSLASIYGILKHYLALDGELADNAVKKLVDYMEREGLAV